MRRARALLAALLVAGLVPAAGCGLGEGEEQAGGGATLRVTRDFGQRALGEVRIDSVREGQTVMRMLRSEFDVTTRFGGRFVQSIDGIEGQGAGGQVDWFFWVNGVEADQGAAEWEVEPGDRIQWDHRDWSAAMRVPAIVGGYPEPFASGLGGKRRPVRVECEDADAPVCSSRRATSCRARACRPRARRSARPAQRRSPASSWRSGPRRRACAARPVSRRARRRRGVFARFTDDGETLELLDERGETARTVRRGDGVGLVLALQPRAEELLWIVTALDEQGLEAGVRALDEAKLRDAFAVAATGNTGREASAGGQMSLVPVYRDRPSALHAARAGAGAALLRRARPHGRALPAPADPVGGARARSCSRASPPAWAARSAARSGSRCRSRC